MKINFVIDSFFIYGWVIFVELVWFLCIVMFCVDIGFGYLVFSFFMEFVLVLSCCIIKDRIVFVVCLGFV